MPLRQGRVDPTGADLPPPPPGWVRDKGCYIPVGTVDGCRDRRAQGVGRCKAPGCSRRVDLDFAELAAMGFGGVQLVDVQKMFECRRPGPCGLRWQNEGYPAGVPLAGYVDTGPSAKSTVVIVACESCRRRTEYTPLSLAATLARHGVGGLGTGVIELPDLIRGACRACNVRRWAVSVVQA